MICTGRRTGFKIFPGDFVSKLNPISFDPFRISNIQQVFDSGDSRELLDERERAGRQAEEIEFVILPLAQKPYH